MYPNDAVGGLEIVPPVRSESCLAANVPDVEGVPHMFEGFDVEPKGRADLCDVLSIELFENRGLPRVVKPKEQKAELLLLLFHLFQDRQKAHEV